jgi:hypothetical protein
MPYALEQAVEPMSKELFERCPGEYWIFGCGLEMLYQRGCCKLG